MVKSLTLIPLSFAGSAESGALTNGFSVHTACAVTFTLCEGAKGTPMRFSLPELLAVYVEILSKEFSPPPCLQYRDNIE